MTTKRLAAAAAAAIATALLAVPLTATAATAATSCPRGYTAAHDSLSITEKVQAGSLRLHWTGTWCASTAKKAVTTVHTHFDGDYSVTKDGKTITGEVVRTRSVNAHAKNGVVLNSSDLAFRVPLTATDGSTTYSTVKVGTTVFGLSPKGWFVAKDGRTRLPDTVTAG